jgi:hypothetical protein
MSSESANQKAQKEHARMLSIQNGEGYNYDPACLERFRKNQFHNDEQGIGVQHHQDGIKMEYA